MLIELKLKCVIWEKKQVVNDAPSNWEKIWTRPLIRRLRRPA